MFSSTLLVAASAFAGLAAAQNSTSNTVIPCCTVPVNSVPQNQRNDWCNAQQNTCVELCGGQGKIASNGNTCDSSTLKFDCKCSNGTDISTPMAQYQQTVPAQMCLYWFDSCINATGTDATAQYNCIQTRNSQCGNLTVSASSGSSSASARASGTASPTSGGASATASRASTSSGAAASLAQFGAPVLAGGLLAIFGLAL